MSEELFEAWGDGTLDADGAERLKALLASPTGARDFARAMRERTMLGVAAHRVSQVPTDAMTSAPVDGPRIIHMVSRVAAVAAAAVLFLVVGLQFVVTKPEVTPPIPTPATAKRDMVIDLRSDAQVVMKIDRSIGRTVSIRIKPQNP